MAVFYRRVLAAQDDIFAVKHRYYLQIWQIVGNFLYGCRLAYSIIYLFDFR